MKGGTIGLICFLSILIGRVWSVVEIAIVVPGNSDFAGHRAGVFDEEIRRTILKRLVPNFPPNSMVVIVIGKLVNNIKPEYNASLLPLDPKDQESMLDEFLKTIPTKTSAILKVNGVEESIYWSVKYVFSSDPSTGKRVKGVKRALILLTHIALEKRYLNQFVLNAKPADVDRVYMLAYPWHHKPCNLEQLKGKTSRADSKGLVDGIFCGSNDQKYGPIIRKELRDLYLRKGKYANRKRGGLDYQAIENGTPTGSWPLYLLIPIGVVLCIGLLGIMPLTSWCVVKHQRKHSVIRRKERTKALASGSWTAEALHEHHDALMGFMFRSAFVDPKKSIPRNYSSPSVVLTRSRLRNDSGQSKNVIVV